jgi:hypothetical protein
VSSSDKDKCEIQRDGVVIATAPVVNDMYKLHLNATSLVAAAAKDEPSMKVWHERLAHLNTISMKQMVQRKLVRGLPSLKGSMLPPCEGCTLGKCHRKPFPKVVRDRARTPLELVHSDVCGPMPQLSVGGARYFVTFIDDFSRYTSVYFLSSKDQVLEKFQEWKARVENMHGEKVKVLRSDNGGEYTSNCWNVAKRFTT